MQIISRLLVFLRHYLTGPKAGVGWIIVAIVSCVAAVVMLVQQFGGFLFTTTVTVGPTSKIEPLYSETGCYRWHLPPRFRSRSVEHLAMMLEDGKPMSRCEHVADVRDFTATHFQVSDSNFRFGTVDGSDVRTNGKLYQVRVPTLISQRWMFFVLGLMVLSLTMIVGRSPPPEWLLRLPSVASRIPAWSVAMIAILASAWGLWIHPDPSHGAMLVKGLPESDAAGWQILSESLAEGRGLGDQFGAQRPLYGVLLAALMLIHPTLLLAKALNVVLVGLIAWGIFVLAKAMRAAWAGLATVVFVVFSGDHVFQAQMVLTELPGLAFGIAAGTILTWALYRRSTWGCGLAGLVMGLGNLACGELLLAVPLTAIFIVSLRWVKAMKGIPCWRLVIAFTAGVTIALGSWMGVQKARYGVFTLSMNSAELLSGGADPVYGKLTFEVHREANEKGFDTRNLVQRYRYFGQRFAADVKAGPLGYLWRVGKATAASLDFVQNDDPVVRTLLVLTVLGSGIAGMLRWRAAMPGIIAGIILATQIENTVPWPAWLLSMFVVALPFGTWRGRRVLALSMTLITIVACMGLCGLAGNVASRRFWAVADWALLLVWLIGLANALQWLFSVIARVPGLNRGMSLTRVRAASLGDLRSCAPVGIGIVLACVFALVVIGVRHLQGPRPKYSADAIAALSQAQTDGMESRLVLFDDFMLTLNAGEHVPHWLPFYYPTNEDRWISRPRLVLPNGALGARVIIEAPAGKLAAPVPQLMRCDGQIVPLKDPISQASIAVLKAERLVPITLPLPQ